MLSVTFGIIRRVHARFKATDTATKRLRQCSSRHFEQLFELFSVGCLFSSELFELIRVVVIFVVVSMVGPNKSAIVSASHPSLTAVIASPVRGRFCAPAPSIICLGFSFRLSVLLTAYFHVRLPFIYIYIYTCIARRTRPSSTAWRSSWWRPTRFPR